MGMLREINEVLSKLKEQPYLSSTGENQESL